MTEIPADFDTDEIEDIRQLAESKGMTEQEFVEYAVNKYVEHIKNEARLRLQTPPKLRAHK